MLAEWLRERDQRKVEQAREEGLEKVREERRLWEAWYERQQAAFREGKPFDEPPPSSPESDDHSKNGQ